MDAATFLPLLFMGVMGLAMLIYVVLDGYDLGVGLLLPFAQSDAHKDLMVASIGPFWDANETWLVLGVGVLLVAFPLAHGIVLTALYLPVAFMLIGLTLRGVAFDFRSKAGDQKKPFWNKMFSVGSALAAVMQGWMLGHYILGFRTDFPALLFAAVIAITVPFSYTLLGAGWLMMKTTDVDREWARRAARRAFPFFVLGILVITAVTPLIAPSIAQRWFRLPDLFWLLPIPVVSLIALVATWRATRENGSPRTRRPWIVFVTTVVVMFSATVGLAYSLIPYIVPGQMDVWQAAAAAGSLKIVLFGVALTLPMILIYTVIVYRVFWGSARDLSYGS